MFTTDDLRRDPLPLIIAAAAALDGIAEHIAGSALEAMLAAGPGATIAGETPYSVVRSDIDCCTFETLKMFGMTPNRYTVRKLRGLAYQAVLQELGEDAADPDEIRTDYFDEVTEGMTFHAMVHMLKGASGRLSAKVADRLFE